MQKNVEERLFYVQKNVSLHVNYVQKNVFKHHFYVQKNVSTIMERHVLQQLKEWKERKDRKPLIVKANPDLQAVRLSMLPYKQQEQLFCVPLYVI
ncbi:hypothetical protein [uncultured Prevotella sp.]|uniref:hypothetical protein n=2 Tax=uncultured Prevotella sp. TaxID=159272 RepID=UPI0027E28CF3|nr:hypothetical protein [uncultured Prevotella sp.]